MSHAMDLMDVESFKSNEMPIVLRETDSYGDIVAFQISVPGTVTASTKAGAIELLAKTLAAGTPTYSKEEIDTVLTRTGALFSIDPRPDYMDISLKCLKKFLPKILPIVSEMLRIPLLKNEEIEIYRSQQIIDLKNEHDHPDAVLQLLSHKAFFKDHPYYNRSNGYLESVPSITREDLTTLVPKLFNKQNVLFSIVGNLTSKEVDDLILAHFSSLPSGHVQPMVGVMPKPKINQMEHRNFESPTTYFMARFIAPSLPDQDYPAMVLATQILDNRLFEEVRTKRGLTYSVSAGIGNSGINSGYVYVSSTQLKEAVLVIFDEIQKMQTEALDTKTLELQIRKFKSSWYLSRELSSSQAKIFAMYELRGGGWRNSNSFMDRLEQVTPDHIQNVMQKYFKNYTMTTVGPEKLDGTFLSKRN